MDTNEEDQNIGDSRIAPRQDTPTLLFGKIDFLENDDEMDQANSASFFDEQGVQVDPAAKDHIHELARASHLVEKNETATIRELVAELTKPMPPERGLVWKVGSTGGAKLRAAGGEERRGALP